MAPMAGACPASLAIAVANAGGMGACGTLLMQPDAIKAWASEVRASSNGGFQLNLWIPDPAPERDLEHEAEVRTFLEQWGPEVEPDAGNAGRWILLLSVRQCWMLGPVSSHLSWAFIPKPL